MADAVTAELRELGLDGRGGRHGAETGSDAGNLLARIAGPDGRRTILLCAHLDTVPLGGPGRGRRRRTACSATATRRSSAPTTRPPSPRSSRAARRLARRGLAGRRRAAVHHLRGAGARRRQGLRPGPAALRVRLRVRPRLADRRAGRWPRPPTTASRPLPRPRRPRRHPARGRPQRDRRRRRRRSRRCELGRLDDADHGQRRPDRGRHRRRTWWPSAARSSSRRAASTRRAPARWSARWWTRPPRPPATRECDVETAVERLFRGYRLPRTAPVGRGGRRGAASRSASSRSTSPPAAAATPTRSIAAGLPVLNVANGTERNHQPDESVTVDALETMLDVTLAIVAAARRRRDEPSSGSAARRSGRARSPPCAWTASATTTARRPSARSSRTPARWPSSPTTASASSWCASRARRWTSRRCSSCRPASSTRRARTRSRPPSASWPRRSARAPRSWRHLTSFYTSPGFADEECHVYLATDLYDESAEAERERAHRDRRGAARPSWTTRSRDCRDAKSLVGLLWFRAYLRAEPTARCSGKGWPPRGRTRVGDGHDRATRVESRASSTWCSTSSPTSSSSAGCRATRSRPTAATCCSSAASWPSAHVSALDASRADVADFLTGLATGDGRPPARLAGHDPPQGRLPALLLPPPAPRGAARLRSDRDAERAAPRPQAAAGAHPRRGGEAAVPAARHRAARRCATARCSS